MRNVSDKFCGENQNTHFVLNNFFPENLVSYEITWRNMAQPDPTDGQYNTGHARFVLDN
jgi:hypothetical protein